VIRLRARYNGGVRIVSALFFSLVAVACGGKRTVGGESPAPTTSAGDEEPAIAEGAPGRKETLSLEFTAVDDREGVEEVSVVMVDETGSSRRTPVDVFSGTCARVAIGDMAGELLAARCTTGAGAGVELRFVLRRGELIVLSAPFAGPDDERSYEQRYNFPLPSGAAIEAAPIDESKP